MDRIARNVYRDKIKALYNELFMRWFTNDESLKEFIISSLLIRNNKILLVGYPGAGKSTLVRLISRALSADGNSLLGVVVGAPEKTLQKVLVSTNIVKLLTTGEEEIIVRPIVKSKIKFINEINRFSKSVQDALLSLLEEGYIEYGGLRFETPEYICFADMNPFRGDIDRALKTRFWGSCYIGLPSLEGSKSILDIMLESERITGGKFDIVETMPRILSFDELRDIWRDVMRVSIPEHIKLFGLMVLSSFRVCKFGKLDLMPGYMRLPCTDCEYANEPCSKIQEPPDERASIALYAYARARAWFTGRERVEIEDILWAVPYVFAHRIELKPLIKSQYHNPWEFLRRYVDWIRDTKIGTEDSPGIWLKALALAAYALNINSSNLKDIVMRNYGEMDPMGCLKELERLALGELGRGDLVVMELYKFVEKRLLASITNMRNILEDELEKIERDPSVTLDRVNAYIEKIKKVPRYIAQGLEERAYKLLDQFRVMFNLEAMGSLSEVRKILLSYNVDAEIVEKVLNRQISTNVVFSNELVHIKRLGKNVIILTQTRDMARELRSAIQKMK